MKTRALIAALAMLMWQPAGSCWAAGLPSIPPGAPGLTPTTPFTATGAAAGRSAADRVTDAIGNVPVTINVLDFGVKGDGSTDDAPAIRSLCSSNRNIIFPGGHTYYLASTVAAFYPASDPVAMLCSQVSNVHVTAYGATFQIAPGIALSQAMLFDRASNWTWDGGTIIGNRTGLSASAENVGFGLFNNWKFRISGVNFSGYGGTGGVFVGDYNANYKISDVQMDGVGIGFDTAFSYHGSIDTIRATGADTNGLSGSGQVGQKFFSNIFDVPLAPTLTLSATASSGATSISYTTTASLTIGTAYPLFGAGIANGTTLTPTSSTAGTLSTATTASIASGATVTAQFNFTPYTFADTDGLSVTNADFSNFASGIALSSGKHMRFSRNSSHDNPGLSTSKGLGYYIYYNNGGNASSVGHPVTDVVIDGGQIVNNGAAVSGYGVLISPPTSGSDNIDGVLVQNVLFDNNVSTAIGADNSTNMANITIGTNTYKGASQTVSVNTNIANISYASIIDNTGSLNLNAINCGINDLGIYYTFSTNYKWRLSASCASGNFYWYNVLGNRIPMTITLSAMAGALTLTSTGIQTAGLYQGVLATPSSSSAICTAGQFEDDALYHYVCTATNTWKRVALTTF